MNSFITLTSGYNGQPMHLRAMAITAVLAATKAQPSETAEIAMAHPSDGRIFPVGCYVITVGSNPENAIAAAETADEVLVLIQRSESP
jgi:hypothetical protein